MSHISPWNCTVFEMKFEVNHDTRERYSQSPHEQKSGLYWKNPAVFSSCQKRGGKKLLEGVKNFFMKKYGPSPFQRRIARISARFSHFLKQFQSLTWNPKKIYKQGPCVIFRFWLFVENLLKIWKKNFQMRLKNFLDLPQQQSIYLKHVPGRKL